MNSETAIEIFIDLLKQGKSVSHIAEGYSMFPTLRPGDIIIVKPLKMDEVPKPGSIVIYMNKGTERRAQSAEHRAQGEERRAQGTELSAHSEGRQKTDDEHQVSDQEQNNSEKYGGLVMHRLIGIMPDNSGEQLFITRGDSRTEPDKPLSRQQLLGVAESYRRGKKEQTVKIFIPGVWRYLLNRILLWLYGKFMRFHNKVRG